MTTMTTMTTMTMKRDDYDRCGDDDLGSPERKRFHAASAPLALSAASSTVAPLALSAVAPSDERRDEPALHDEQYAAKSMAFQKEFHPYFQSKLSPNSNQLANLQQQQQQQLQQQYSSQLQHGSRPDPPPYSLLQQQQQQQQPSVGSYSPTGTDQIMAPPYQPYSFSGNGYMPEQLFGSPSPLQHYTQHTNVQQQQQQQQQQHQHRRMGELKEVSGE